jgi:hypothetical protein
VLATPSGVIHRRHRTPQLAWWVRHHRQRPGVAPCIPRLWPSINIRQSNVASVRLHKEGSAAHDKSFHRTAFGAGDFCVMPHKIRASVRLPHSQPPNLAHVFSSCAPALAWRSSGASGDDAARVPLNSTLKPSVNCYDPHTATHVWPIPVMPPWSPRMEPAASR